MTRGRNPAAALALCAGLLALVGCGEPPDSSDPDAAAAGKAATSAPALDADEHLKSVLEAQPRKVRERYSHRHPQATLAFFGIEPGMTVVEVLPGAGWYTKILLPYLGPEGRLIGADYPIDMFPLFGFFSDEALASKETWVDDWRVQARGWAGEDGAEVGAFQLGAMPAPMAGTADAVLFIRALHNLARFESEGGYISDALATAFRVLEPGGVVGVVQHRAPAAAPDAWADGSAGYLKAAFVVASFEDAGFELVARSEINANPQDKPTPEDIVWRLPPSLDTSEAGSDVRAAYKAVGESDRMTLLFRKPTG